MTPQEALDAIIKWPNLEEVKVLTDFINLKLKAWKRSIQIEIFNEFSNASGQKVIDEFKKNWWEVKRNTDSDIDIDQFEFTAKDWTYSLWWEVEKNEEEEGDEYTRSINHRK